MIQRVQSLYMLIAIGLIVISYFLPLGYLATFAYEYTIRSYGIKDADGLYLSEVSSYWFHLPLAMIVVSNMFSVLMFRNRKLQIKLLRFTFLLFAASFALLSYYIYQAGLAFPEGSLTPGISLMFLFGALVSNWLAARAIRRDEELIRSVDRIR